MSLDGARRVMETTDSDTVNQYLRFGWKLINQHVVEANHEGPARMKYVLASIRVLEDTKELATLDNSDKVNAYLALGWKLIDKLVSDQEDPLRRHESIRFIVAWQNDSPAVHPGSAGSPLEGKLPSEIELE